MTSGIGIRIEWAARKAKYRWRELVCALIGHRWWYGVDRGDGYMDWKNRPYPAERKWCGRCSRNELNL